MNIQNTYICNSNEIWSCYYKFLSLCSKDVTCRLLFWTLAASSACENDDFWFEKNGYFNCCRNSHFLSQKPTNNTTGVVSRQWWNLQVSFSRISRVWLYHLNVHRMTNAILTTSRILYFLKFTSYTSYSKANCTAYKKAELLLPQ